MSPKWWLVAVVAATGVIAAVAIPVAMNQPTPIPRRCLFGNQKPEAAATGERMSLGLDGRGGISEVTVGRRRLPMLRASGGFRVRVAGDAKNLVPNGGFESDRNSDGRPDGWRVDPGAGVQDLTTSAAHSGQRSMRISLPSEAVSIAFSKTIPVTPSTNYVLSAWFRSENVQPTIPPAVRETYHRQSPIQVEAEQTTEGETRVAAAHGYTDSAEWNRQFVGFKTGRDVRHVVIRGLIRNGSGIAWYDDVSLTKLFPRGSTPVGGRITRAAGIVKHHGTALDDALALDATYRARTDHVRVDGRVRTSRERDLPVQVSYTLPVDATGWGWGDDGRRTRIIRRGVYASLSNSSIQQTSVYPFGAVFDRRSNLAIGVPLSKPRMFRIEYDRGRGLTVTFDLGLSGAAATGRRADFSFVVFTADPSWGFRAATKRYYELFPGSFVRRTDPACEGAWFVAPPLDSIERSYRDFGLGLNMVALGKASTQSHSAWGIPYVSWDDSRGIYTSAYGHHWAFYQPIGSTRSPTPPYEEAISRLRGLASGTRSPSTGPRLRDEARAAFESTSRDFNGRLYYERYGRFLAYYQNPDPSLRWADAVERYQMLGALWNARRNGGRLDGLHLDSTSGMRRWGAADDYDRRHWSAATLPLTFSYHSGLVTQRGLFPLYSHIADVADFVHGRRMILSANFNADLRRTGGFVGADHIDYFGIEQGLESRAKGRSADPFALWKRTLAYHRPISTLDARIGAGRLPLWRTERQLQQNLFYGIFAGAWNPKTEAEASGEEAKWTREPVARLWARYTPVFRKLAAAGWEPVTHARTSNQAVWVERFGTGSEGTLHFTVRNETSNPIAYRLRIDLDALEMSSSAAVTVVEEVTRRRVRAVTEDGGVRAIIPSTIPPASTRVFTLDLRS